MKKIIAIIVFICIFITNYIFAQADEKKHERNITVSTNYLYTNIYLSSRYIHAGSILTWRDVRLHGAEVNVEINKESSKQENIGLGFSSSYRGHHTDDDTTNRVDGISAGSVDAILATFSYEVVTEYKDIKLDLKLGVDFNYLKLEDYDFKIYYANDETFYLDGLGSKYDLYKFCFYGGVQKKFEHKTGYLVLFGQSGIGMYVGLADWIHRTEFKHPISFSDIGLLFRGSSGFDMGFKLNKSSTFFCKAQILYEISPGLAINIQYGVDNRFAAQRIFLEYLNASLGAGFKIKF